MNIFQIKEKNEKNIYYKIENSKNKILIVKYSPDGQELWTETLELNPLTEEYGVDIELDKKGNLCIIGTIKNSCLGICDIFILKYDIGNKSIIWKQIWGGSKDDYVEDLVIDDNDNIYVIGNTESYGSGEKDNYSEI
ncbi:MAG: SBBP repeat-containing protein [Promethearchaeia archaeon]